MLYKSAEELIGNTPLLELTHINETLEAKIFAKLECFNPAGSAKDRVAKAIIDDYEEKGLINKNTLIIEPTSGNTGIGLAMIAAIRGYKAVIVMPDSMSRERCLMMTAYGAELVLTDGSKGMKGAIEEAEKIKKENPDSIIAGQFVNPANPKAHFETTGPEIYRDLGDSAHILVAGVGTGGTLTGAGRYLKSKSANISVVAIEPQGSPVLSGGKAGAHGLQGIGAGFVPEITDTDIIDEIVCVTEEEAFSAARLMAKKEGLLVGISSGAALHGAMEIAKRKENKGKNIVVVLPDTGTRYLSSDLF